MQIEVNHISFNDKSYWIKNIWFLFKKTFVWFITVGFIIVSVGKLNIGVIPNTILCMILILMSFNVCQIMYENTYGKKRIFNFKNFLKSNFIMLMLEINYKFFSILMFLILFVAVQYGLEMSGNITEVNNLEKIINSIILAYLCLSTLLDKDFSVFTPMLNREFNIIKKKELFALCREAELKNKMLAKTHDFIILISIAIISSMLPVLGLMLIPFVCIFHYLIFREIFIGKTKIKEEIKVEVEESLKDVTFIQFTTLNFIKIWKDISTSVDRD